MSRDDTVDPGSPIPAYRQLETILRRRIEAGEWRTGPLPSVAYLQHEYEVGRDTVLRALALLREADLIFTVPKRGSYVTPRETTRHRQTRDGEPANG